MLTTFIYSLTYLIKNQINLFKPVKFYPYFSLYIINLLFLYKKALKLYLVAIETILTSFIPKRAGNIILQRSEFLTFDTTEQEVGLKDVRKGTGRTAHRTDYI
jgi:hypothetical protein